MEHATIQELAEMILSGDEHIDNISEDDRLTVIVEAAATLYRAVETIFGLLETREGSLEEIFGDETPEEKFDNYSDAVNQLFADAIETDCVIKRQQEQIDELLAFKEEILRSRNDGK